MHFCFLRRALLRLLQQSPRRLYLCICSDFFMHIKSTTFFKREPNVSRTSIYLLCCHSRHSSSIFYNYFYCAGLKSIFSRAGNNGLHYFPLRKNNKENNVIITSVKKIKKLLPFFSFGKVRVE